MELSITKLKYITSLHQKKNREEQGLFIAEGIKVINDLIKFGFVPQMIVYNPALWDLKDFGQSHAFCEYFTANEIQDKKLKQVKDNKVIRKGNEINNTTIQGEKGTL